MASKDVSFTAFSCSTGSFSEITPPLQNSSQSVKCASASATARFADSARAALRRAFFPDGNGAGAPSGPPPSWEIRIVLTFRR
ncbi:hypothetical protein AB0D57_17240 [Streptomyces sp. NPDC048275]|uniref:hypothetical protein n=1 Tax=Streptomyces sp. NPDC048275 TaxID=3155629 RepID=UPI0033E812E7